MILNYGLVTRSETIMTLATKSSQNIFKLRFGLMELCSYGNQTIDMPLTTLFILF